MQFTKSSPQLVATFDAVVPGPPALTRPMFGYPAAFVNGNMFMSLFQESMILRLPEDARAELMRAGGSVFEPMKGRPMREYVVVPPAMLKKRDVLEAWVQRSLDYVGSIAPKTRKVRKTKKAASKKSTAGRTTKRPR